ncbi:unnamed protein product [Amoebophrya sp. A25]|nr:unnamed protein product [Amoebophrya sp. A25]|eukprot:GSA25T00006556001.1
MSIFSLRDYLSQENRRIEEQNRTHNRTRDAYGRAPSMLMDLYEQPPATDSQLRKDRSQSSKRRQRTDTDLSKASYSNPRTPVSTANHGVVDASRNKSSYSLFGDCMTSPLQPRHSAEFIVGAGLSSPRRNPRRSSRGQQVEPSPADSHESFNNGGYVDRTRPQQLLSTSTSTTTGGGGAIRVLPPRAQPSSGAAVSGSVGGTAPVIMPPSTGGGEQDAGTGYSYTTPQVGGGIVTPATVWDLSSADEFAPPSALPAYSSSPYFEAQRVQLQVHHSASAGVGTSSIPLIPPPMSSSTSFYTQELHQNYRGLAGGQGGSASASNTSTPTLTSSAFVDQPYPRPKRTHLRKIGVTSLEGINILDEASKSTAAGSTPLSSSTSSTRGGVQRDPRMFPSEQAPEEDTKGRTCEIPSWMYADCLDVNSDRDTELRLW